MWGILATEAWKESSRASFEGMCCKKFIVIGVGSRRKREIEGGHKSSVADGAKDSNYMLMISVKFLLYRLPYSKVNGLYIHVHRDIYFLSVSIHLVRVDTSNSTYCNGELYIIKLNFGIFRFLEIIMEIF